MQYLKEHRNERPTTIARALVANRPDLFKSVEQARSSVRYYCALMGTHNRKKLSTTEFVTSPVVKRANVLLLDIETTPVWSYTWDVWKQNVAPVQIIRGWNMLSWSAKWLFEPDVMGDVLTTKEAQAGDDKRITKSMWDILEQADVVVVHNGVAFDMKKILTRFIIHGFGPTTPYQVIDTCLIARKKFGFEHNKLDFIAAQLGLPRKLDTDFQLWIDCMHGKKEALAHMLMYNKQDVMILEEVYVKLRPWVPAHPNMGLFVDVEAGGMICPVCGKTNLTETGTYNTTINTYNAFRCNDCGAIGRNRITSVPIKKKQQLLHSVAR